VTACTSISGPVSKGRLLGDILLEGRFAQGVSLPIRR
jgi:hypothetical protein